LLSNIPDFDPAKDLLAPDELLSLDAWAVARTAELQEALKQDYDSYQLHLLYQKLHNFCSVELGGFYLDIIKDRLYTTATDSKARRSAQTAVYWIIESLVRWIAPILSFTADEIWTALPKADRDETVFTAEWLDLPTVSADMGYWKTVAKIKSAVNKVIEDQRAEGVIGGALSATVVLYADGEVYDAAVKLGDELRFVLITSGARVEAFDQAVEQACDTEVDGLKVAVAKATGQKCVRCYHVLDSVGSDEAHPEICPRCVSNIEQSGETREFA
jgi:isoleucyl-tRNA synthetase